jgi:hypothetical protein
MLSQRLQNLANFIASKCKNYQKKNQRFPQILNLMDEPPTVGQEEKSVTRIDRSPTDQIHTSRDVLGRLPETKYPVDIRVDIYDGPKGKGFVIIFTRKINDNLFEQYRINYGSEIYRNTERWIQFNPNEEI